MNIKKFIADKIKINKKKIFKKSLKECFFSFVGLSVVFNSISYLATKDKFDINSFLFVSGFIFFLLSVSFLINLAIEKYLIKKENNDILLSSENFGKYFKKKDINEEGELPRHKETWLQFLTPLAKATSFSPLAGIYLNN